MVRDLTVRERITLHLFDFSRYAEEYEVPLDVTQTGITAAVGIRVQHATQYLKPLLSEALIEERMSHIRKKPRRRKAYFLTAGGRHQAASLRRRLLRHHSRSMTPTLRTAISPSRISWWNLPMRGYGFPLCM